MNRGDLYRSSHDPKRSRVFVVISRQTLIDSNFSTVICAPVYSRHDGLSTQLSVSVSEGLKHDSSIHCDELVSLQKIKLTNFIGGLSEKKLSKLNESLMIALEILD